MDGPAPRLETEQEISHACECQETDIRLSEQERARGIFRSMMGYNSQSFCKLWRGYATTAAEEAKWFEGESRYENKDWDTANVNGSPYGEGYERLMALMNRRPGLAGTHPFRTHNGCDSGSLHEHFKAFCDSRVVHRPISPYGPVLPPKHLNNLALTSGIPVSYTHLTLPTTPYV